jgi:hypothetical protein
MHQAMALAGRVALAVGMAGVGVLSFVYTGLDPHWQHPPERYDTAPLAYASGAILIAASAAMLTPKTAKLGGYALAALLVLWVIAFNTPRILAGVEAAWLAPAEVVAAACGAWIATGAERGPRIVQALFGFCLITFGAAHFLYLDFTAGMIPAFIPFHPFFAAFTGAGHIAAGLSIISGVIAGIGSALLALMFSLFVLLVHIPRVIADPGDRIEWTMLSHATALTGAALLVAASIWKARRSRK